MEYAADDRTEDALSTVNGIESNNLLVASLKMREMWSYLQKPLQIRTA